MFNHPTFEKEATQKTKKFLAMVEDADGQYHETEISFSYVELDRRIEVVEYDSTVKFRTWEDSIEAVIEQRFGLPVSFWKARSLSL